MLEQREKTRGNRSLGEAACHLKTHGYCRYHVEVDTMDPLDFILATTIEAWRQQSRANV